MLQLFDLKEDLLQWLPWKSFTPTLINYEVMRSHLRVNCEGPWCMNWRNWTCQLVRSVWEVTLQKRILWSFQFRTECGRPKWELLEYDTTASDSIDSIDSRRLSEKFNTIIYYCYSIVIAYKNPRLKCNTYYAIPKSQLCLIQNLETLILDRGALELYLMQEDRHETEDTNTKTDRHPTNSRPLQLSYNEESNTQNCEVNHGCHICSSQGFNCFP